MECWLLSWARPGKCPREGKEDGSDKTLRDSTCSQKPPMRSADILADAAQHAFLSACSARAAWGPSGSSTAPAGGDRGGPHGSLAAARAGSSGRGTPGLGCTQHPPPPGEMPRGRTRKTGG